MICKKTKNDMQENTADEPKLTIYCLKSELLKLPPDVKVTNISLISISLRFKEVRKTRSNLTMTCSWISE